MRRITILLLLTISSLILLSGCLFSTSKEEELAVNLLTEKYGEEFMIEEVDKPMFKDYFIAWLRPLRNPDIVVKTKINKETNAFKDDFPARVMCHAVSDEFYNGMYLEGDDGAFFIHTDTKDAYTKEKDPDITPEEFLKAYPDNTVTISFVMEEGTMAYPFIVDGLKRATAEMKKKGFTVKTITVEDGSLQDVQNAVERYDDMKSKRAKKELKRHKIENVI